MLKVIAVFGLALLSLAASFAIVGYWPADQSPAPQAQGAPPAVAP